MFDMDNDGYNDIYICNGINHDLTNQDFLNYYADPMLQKMETTGDKKSLYDILDKMPSTPIINKAFRNIGDLKFTDAAASWGFTQPSFSNGAAYVDLDNDGALDLVVNNENGPAFIYRNNSRQTNKNHYIGVFLHAPSPNTFAIGSKIRVYQAGQIFYRELIPSRGFQSSVDYKQIIGLGQLTGVDSLCITWPDGSSSHVDHPALDSVYTIRQNSTTTRPANNTRSAPLHQKPAPPHTLAPASHSLASLAPAPGLLPHRPAAPLLLPIAAAFDKHQEDDNIDFNFEHNLPKMLSREGPKAACGDVNGDGLTDVFIGGTPQHPGQLYLQTPDGHFIKSKQPAFDQFIDFEDEAVLLFDADHDGDLDLFIGPGGNNNPPYSRQMQLRLFKNDGKGHFTPRPRRLPPHHQWWQYRRGPGRRF